MIGETFIVLMSMIVWDEPELPPPTDAHVYCLTQPVYEKGKLVAIKEKCNE